MKSIVYGVSIKGNAHYIVGTPCQDSNSYEPIDNSEDEIKVIAISDGHGGSQYYRSDVGSFLAVKIAKEELYRLVLESKPLLDKIDEEIASLGIYSSKIFSEDAQTSERAILESGLNTLKSELNARIDETKKAIVSKWRGAVLEHLIANPVFISFARMHELLFSAPASELGMVRGYVELDNEKINFINRGIDSDIISRIKSNPYSLYGATLLAVAQYKSHLIILKLGDGDVTIIKNDDSVMFPIEDKEYEILNQTNSICQTNAISNFDSLYLKENAKIIMLNSDGVPNCFKEKSDISKVALNIHQNLVEEADSFKAEIRSYIRDFSADENSNGDDCTIAFIANEIPDEAYEVFVGSEEVEENYEELEKAYTPMFTDYELKNDSYEHFYNENGCIEKIHLRLKGSKIDDPELVQKRHELESAKAKMSALVQENQNELFIDGLKAILDDISNSLDKHMIKIKKEREEYIKNYLNQNKVLVLENTLYKLMLLENDISVEKNEEFSIILNSKNNALEIKPISKEAFESNKLLETKIILEGRK